MIRITKLCVLLVGLLSWILYVILYSIIDPGHAAVEEPRQLCPPNPEVPLPPSYSQLHRYEKAAVCSDSSVCSSIGSDVLRQGGSAVDAALATLLCNGLVAPQSMGLGGGLLMNVYKQDERRSYSVMARERAPQAAGEEAELSGAAAIGVPCEVAGYAAAHRRFGRLPWASLVRPTIDLCRRGFPLTMHQWDALQSNAARVRQDAHLARLYVDAGTGRFHPVGTHIRPATELCETYELLALHGPDDFYRGHVARLLAQDLQDLGSAITADDLSSVRVEVEPSATLPLGRHTLHLTPPPSSGQIVGFVMNILAKFRRDFTSRRELGARDVHRIVEALKFGFVGRWELDQETRPELLANLTSAVYARLKAGLIDDTRTFDDPRHYGAPAELAARPEHGTAHVSVLAPNGDAVSATSSINFYFGSGRTGARSGVLFNNAMADFNIDGQRNYFDLPNVAGRNRLRPGHSPASSMAPLVVTDPNGRVRLVVGAAGGTKIISALTALLVRVLWMEQSIKQGIDGARFHHQLLPNVLEYEFGVQQTTVGGLEARGHQTLRYQERGSAVCGIERKSDEVFGNADFRKDGGVAGF